MSSSITKKALLKLIKQYNVVFRLQQYYYLNDRQTKEQIINQITKRNYKIVRNNTASRWELHPVKDPRRTPKIIGSKDPPKPKVVKIATHLKQMTVGGKKKTKKK